MPWPTKHIGSERGGREEKRNRLGISPPQLFYQQNSAKFSHSVFFHELTKIFSDIRPEPRRVKSDQNSLPRNLKSNFFCRDLAANNKNTSQDHRQIRSISFHLMDAMRRACWCDFITSFQNSPAAKTQCRNSFRFAAAVFQSFSISDRAWLTDWLASLPAPKRRRSPEPLD